MRVAAGVVVAVLGSLGVLFFLGGTVAMCLGPLGVTAVQCAAHGGPLPTEGAWVPASVASVALGIIVAAGRLRAAAADAATALGGGAIGAIAYFARRPTTLDGPDYDGTWRSIPLPVEPWTLCWWAVAGALVGLAALAVARRLRA